ncbi:MAG TPA: alpha/beta hydrolase [Capillimicrobium sp.]|nr:alpha/beta hydrolase [Capillimicrobium sp.]
MPLLEANGIRLMVDDAGAGEPLVLVHGSWDDRSVWGLVRDELARSFRVVAYDRRGHTDSEDGAEPGTRRDDEDDLAALVEVLGAAPAYVVANSFGSSIALGMAVRAPELVRGLCLHEPPLIGLLEDAPIGDALGPVIDLIETGEHTAAAQRFVDEVALGPGAWEAMGPEDRAVMVRNAPTFAEELRDPAAFGVDLDAVAALQRPVLLTRGDRSPPFFEPIVDILASTLPRAEVRTIRGAGHVPHVTHPAEYVAVVRDLAATTP